MVRVHVPQKKTEEKSYVKEAGKEGRREDGAASGLGLLLSCRRLNAGGREGGRAAGAGRRKEEAVGGLTLLGLDCL